MTAVATAPRRPDLSALAPRVTVVRQANATLLERKDVTARLARFVVRPDLAPTPFAAGQYVSVGLDDPEIHPRPYSVASGPGDRDLEFVISLVPEGTLTRRLFELERGARLHLGPARGLFRLDPAETLDHLLVGTGSGVAPFLAMVSELRDRRRPPRTILLHGTRVRAELAATGLSGSAGVGWLSYRPVLSKPLPEDAWRGWTGHVGPHLKEMCASGDVAPARTVAYLCGNPAMIAECVDILTCTGMPADAIRVERFT